MKKGTTKGNDEENDQGKGRAVKQKEEWRVASGEQNTPPAIERCKVKRR
jgi:hypothetical protein